MKTKLGTLLFLSLTLLLSVSACGPTPPPTPTPTAPPTKLVGLWRFANREQYTVEFRPDSTFEQTYLADKSIWNHGAYVVDNTKNPAWIDIDAMPDRTFEMIGGTSGQGVYKGIIRFRNANVAEIAVSNTGRPDSFDNSLYYIIVIYRVQP